jgi:hypothetical protein
VPLLFIETTMQGNPVQVKVSLSLGSVQPLVEISLVSQVPTRGVKKSSSSLLHPKNKTILRPNKIVVNLVIIEKFRI